MNSHKFFDKIEIIDNLLGQSPSLSIIERALRLISDSGVLLNYAFIHLDRDDWLLPLRAAKQFNTPPELVPDENGNLRGPGVWPQADYLVRMARKGDVNVQGQILDILLEVGDTNNYFIHRQFAEAALAMPADLAAKWAKHEIEWLRKGNTTASFMEDELGKLVSKLAKEDQVKTALELMAELLAVLPDPDKDKKIQKKGRAEVAFLEPQIRCEKYLYEQLLESILPDLANVAPFETMDMLCDLLNKATEYSVSESDEKQYDMSSVNRPTIEDNSQNYDFYFQHDLINALRDVAVKLSKESHEKLREVVEKLESYGWNIFQRLALHVLKEAENPPVDMIEKRLVNEELCEYVGVHHEYFHLMKTHFDRLSSEGQQKIFEWIDTAEKLKERDHLIHQDKELLSLWRYRHLSAIEEYLTGDRKEAFIKLKSQFSDQDIPPDFNTWHGGVTAFVPRSPKNAEELAEMSMADLVKFLKEWKSSGEWKAPSVAGLSAMLGALVEKQPEKFIEEIERFMDKDINPTYIRQVISAFQRVIESGKLLSYVQLFKLLKWVVDQPSKTSDQDAPKGYREGLDGDVGWKGAKMEIAWLFGKLFEDKTQLSFDLRNEAWEIIEPLTEDSDPDIEHEKSYDDAMDLSLNTIRGRALYNVMCYAMWVCRHIKRIENRNPHFDDSELQKVKDMLEKHLDIANEKYGKCRTDRAVYGQWLPQLVHVDTDWVKSNINRMFPDADEYRPLRYAVWNTYLMYAGLYNQVYDVLQDVYCQEVETLAGKKIGEDSYKSPDRKLAEHVVILYGRGKIGLDDGGLVDVFFRAAPAELTHHAMDFVGRSMNSKIAPEPDLAEKVRNLWDWRVEMVDGFEGMPPKELSTFSWWFSCGHLDEEWTFPRLKETLKRVGIAQSNPYIFDRMIKVFKDYPGQSLGCLKLFVENNDDPWFFYGHKKEGVRALLEQGMNHDNQEIRDEAEEIIHLLGYKGYLEYRELLKKG